MFKARITITLRPSILDPQGKAVHHALDNLGYHSVESVRMGKYAELLIDEKKEEDARRVAQEACDKLLANAVMEDFSVVLERVEEERV